MTSWTELETRLRSEFPGYHVDLYLFPMGGRLELEACDECDTARDYDIRWHKREPVLNNIDAAIEALKQEMAKEGE